MNAKAYVLQGRDLLAAGHARKALVLFREGLKAHPDDLQLRLGMGLAYTALGDHGTACNVLGTLCETHPAWEEPRLAIIESLIARGRPYAAIHMARWGLGDVRKNTKFVLSAAALFLARGCLVEADELYRKAAEYNPQSSLAQLGLARCLIARKESRAGLAALKATLGLAAPTDWPVIQDVAKLMYNLGPKKHAFVLFEQIPASAFNDREAVECYLNLTRYLRKARRVLLEQRLAELPHQPGPEEDLAIHVEVLERRMSASTKRRWPRPQGAFWRGIPTIVPQCEDGFALDQVLGKIFIKTCSFTGVSRPRVRRLDKNLFDRTINSLGSFLEGYPWDCRASSPTFEPGEDVFETSGVVGLMYYCAAMLKAAPRLINPVFVDRVALLRLKQAAARLESKIPLGKPPHRAWLELTVALQGKAWA